MPRVTEEYKQLVRARIIEEAGRIFAEKGVQNTRMEEIAESIGASKPVIYQYFDGKQQLLEEVSIHLMNDFYDSIARTVEEQGIETIRDGSFFEKVQNNLIWSPLLTMEVCGLMNTRPELNEEYLKSYTNALGTFIRILDKAKEQGTIATNVDTSMLAMGLFAFLDGLGMHTLMGVDYDTAKRVWTTMVNGFFR